MTRTLRSRIRLIVLYVLVVFLFQELALRVCFPLPEMSTFDRVNYIGLHKENRRASYLRDQQWYWESAPDTNYLFVHKMNRYGYRDHEWKVEKPENKKRIFFIGDSFVEGVMATQNQTIPKGFESMLEADKYEVLNGGMMGTGIESYLKLIADAVPVFKPDLIFLVLYSNDIPKKIPEVPERTMEPVRYSFFNLRLLELIHQAKIGHPVNVRWNAEKKPFLQSGSKESHPWYNKSELLQKHTTPELASMIKAGRLNPYKINQLLKEEVGLKKLMDLGETLPFLKYYTDKYNTEIVVCYVPSKHQVTKHYYQFDQLFCLQDYPENIDLTKDEYNTHQKSLAESCQQNGLSFIDLTSEIKTEEDENNHLYWNYDEHMKGNGYLFVGKSIYKKWKKLNPHSN